MGKVYSILIRPIRSFNIENRAARIISQQKPVPAPQYPSTEKQKKLSEEGNIESSMQCLILTILLIDY